ncbi:MAG: hypothetical protein ACYSSI_13870, partial [Planctomycetota bacterium]
MQKSTNFTMIMRKIIKFFTITLIISLLCRDVAFSNPKDRSALRVPLSFATGGVDSGEKQRAKSTLALMVRTRSKFNDEFEALEWLIKNAPSEGWGENYNRMMHYLLSLGKLDQDKLVQAHMLGSAYDFYLKKYKNGDSPIKRIIDNLRKCKDEWQALEEVKSLKEEDSPTAPLFKEWNYSSIMPVLYVAGKLSRKKLQQAKRLGDAYDFYLKKDENGDRPIKRIIDNLRKCEDEYQAFEEVRTLKKEGNATAFLFEALGHASMMPVLCVAGRLDRKKLQHAQRLGSAYDFYLKKDEETKKRLVKAIIDKLPKCKDEYQAFEEVKALKEEGSPAAFLFEALSYSSMMPVLCVAGRLDRKKLQQAQRLGGAYDFYLKKDEETKKRLVGAIIDDIPRCIDDDTREGLSGCKDEWQALEEVKSLKEEDSPTAPLFKEWSRSSMMLVLCVAGKLDRKKLQQAQRLASPYDCYIRKDKKGERPAKAIIDKLPECIGEYQALKEIRTIKEDPSTAPIFETWGYSSMMSFLCVADDVKLHRDKLQAAERLGAAADYTSKRKKMISALFKIAWRNLELEDKKALTSDLNKWDCMSRPNLNKFKGINTLIRFLLRPEYEKRFPYSKDIRKPAEEQQFLAEATRRNYLIAALIFFKEEIILMAEKDIDYVYVREDISVKEAKDMLSELVKNPPDFDWEEEDKKGNVPNLKGLRLGYTYDNGTISFNPFPNYTFRLPVLGFCEKGWEVVIIDSKVRYGRLEYTVRLTKKNRKP